MWFDLDKIATQMFYVETNSPTLPRQHIKKLNKHRRWKIFNLHKYKMAAKNNIFCQKYWVNLSNDVSTRRKYHIDVTNDLF